MNAHINYDLPQALVAVISDEQFDDAALLARREADHRMIDEVLATRVAAEDDELTRLSGPAPLLDRLLRPVSRLGTQRFLREAREKVWANATVLNRARRQRPGRLRGRPGPAGGTQRRQGHRHCSPLGRSCSSWPPPDSASDCVQIVNVGRPDKASQEWRHKHVTPVAAVEPETARNRGA